MAAIFESEEILDRLVGAWWFFGLYVVNAVFNTILGEEFLFRGVASENGGSIWQVELGSKRCASWLVPRPPALGYPGVCH